MRIIPPCLSCLEVIPIAFVCSIHCLDVIVYDVDFFLFKSVVYAFASYAGLVMIFLGLGGGGTSAPKRCSLQRGDHFPLQQSPYPHLFISIISEKKGFTNSIQTIMIFYSRTSLYPDFLPNCSLHNVCFLNITNMQVRILHFQVLFSCALTFGM